MLLPNANPSSDAVGYAATQRWDSMHCSAHHVLYHLWWTLLLQLFPILKGMDLLSLMQAGNALAAGLVLWFSGLIVSRYRAEYTGAVVLFIGASFGFMRYATENETYIMPLLFGVLALWFITGTFRGKWWWSALALALAMLFHQSYVFWWMAAVWYAFRTEGIKKALIPSSALLLTALVYQAAAMAEGEPLWRFVFHDVYEGGVQTSISLKNFYMTPVSLLRSFIQVHGYMLWSWKHDGAWSVLLSIAAGGLMVYAGVKLLRNLRKPDAAPLWKHFLLPALVLHLLFAFYSEGNAEFMVMIPLLLALGMASGAFFPARPVFFTGLALLFWNLIQGLLPWHFRDFYGHGQLLAKWVKRPPDWYLVSEEPVMMRNLYYYHFGVQDSRRILESPEWAVSKGKSADSAVAAMETILASSFINKVWYADYSRYLYNRAAATRAVMPSEGINRFRMEAIDSFRNMNGMQHIYLVEGRK
ncbi:MAG: hypothetical protein KJS92_00605 [Bacteroidetes bacterium]|nr:hypothetical protein [Bacteroidota bacterium]